MPPNVPLPMPSLLLAQHSWKEAVFSLSFVAAFGDSSNASPFACVYRIFTCHRKLAGKGRSGWMERRQWRWKGRIVHPILLAISSLLSPLANWMIAPVERIIWFNDSSESTGATHQQNKSNFHKEYLCLSFRLLWDALFSFHCTLSSIGGTISNLTDFSYRTKRRGNRNRWLCVAKKKRGAKEATLNFAWKHNSKMDCHSPSLSSPCYSLFVLLCGHWWNSQVIHSH